MQVTIPNNLKDVEHEIKEFVEAMVYKLHVNAHKGKWEGLDIPDLLRLMMGEVEELIEASQGPWSDDVRMEAADVANFAMMVASVVRRKENG